MLVPGGHLHELWSLHSFCTWGGTHLDRSVFHTNSQVVLLYRWMVIYDTMQYIKCDVYDLYWYG